MMPRWSKNDYEMVASVLRTTEMTEHERASLTSSFGWTFSADNPVFNEPRFIDAIYEGKLKRPSLRHGGWSRKDYEMVADTIRRSSISDATQALVAQAFADRFYFDNPTWFSSDKFYTRALGSDYKTRIFHHGPTRAEQAEAAWRAKHGFPSTPLRRRPEVRVKPYRRVR